MYSVDPESAHAYVLAGMSFTAAPFILAQVLGMASLLDSPGMLILSAVSALLVVFAFARFMTAESQKGVPTKVEILGSRNLSIGWNPVPFASSMHALATDAHQAFVAAPRSSSSG